MKLIDIIIILVLALIIGLVCYFYFWKNRDQPCHNCPYCNSCDKNTKLSKNKSNCKKNVNNN